MTKTEILSIMSAVAVTTVSNPINIEGVKKITLEFTRTLHSAGSTVFKCSFSIDGVTYVDSNLLIDNVANTNAQTLTRVASASLASDTTKHYSVDLSFQGFKYMKVTATRTIDGSATVKAYVEKEF